MGLRDEAAERQVHGMIGLARKINREPGKYGVHRRDFSKAPTAVHAITADGQLRERLDQMLLGLASSAATSFSNSSFIIYLISRAATTDWHH